MKIDTTNRPAWPEQFNYGYCHRYRKGINDEANGNIQVEQTGSGFRSKWIPSDTPVRYEQLKDKVQKFGYTADNVTYEINNHGFRHPDVFVENTNSIVFLGCSITFGIGVNYEETFAYKVAEHFSMDCINLGQPGSAINACYRHAKVWLPIIKPAMVVLLYPNPSRRELWEKGSTEEGFNNSKPDFLHVGNWTGKSDPSRFQYETMYNMHNDINEKMLFEDAYLDAIKGIVNPKQKAYRSTVQILTAPAYKLHSEYLQTVGQSIMEQEVDDIQATTREEAPVGRDLLHPGPKMHTSLAHQIIANTGT